MVQEAVDHVALTIVACPVTLKQLASAHSATKRRKLKPKHKSEKESALDSNTRTAMEQDGSQVLHNRLDKLPSKLPPSPAARAQ